MVPERFTDVSPQPSVPRGSSLCDTFADLNAAIRKSAFHFTISYMYIYDKSFTPLCIIKANFPFDRRKRVRPPTGFRQPTCRRHQRTWRSLHFLSTSLHESQSALLIGSGSAKMANNFPVRMWALDHDARLISDLIFLSARHFTLLSTNPQRLCNSITFPLCVERFCFSSHLKIFPSSTNQWKRFSKGTKCGNHKQTRGVFLPSCRPHEVFCYSRIQFPSFHQILIQFFFIKY